MRGDENERGFRRIDVFGVHRPGCVVLLSLLGRVARAHFPDGKLGREVTMGLRRLDAAIVAGSSNLVSDRYAD